MQRLVELVHIDKDLERYIADIVGRTRSHSSVEVGSSPRGSLAILKLAKAQAWLDRRDYVLPDDVKAVAVPALNHRMILTADNWLRGTKPESIVEDILGKVPVPKVQVVITKKCQRNDSCGFSRTECKYRISLRNKPIPILHRNLLFIGHFFEKMDRKRVLFASKEKDFKK